MKAAAGRVRMYTSVVLIFNVFLFHAMAMQGHDQAPIIVRVAQRSGKVAYTVNGRPSPDLLRSLVAARHEFGSDRWVMVLADESLPIENLRGVAGTAAKAGLPNRRFFTVTADGEYMGEIIFKAYVPFSESLP